MTIEALTWEGYKQRRIALRDAVADATDLLEQAVVAMAEVDRERQGQPQYPGPGDASMSDLRAFDASIELQHVMHRYRMVLDKLSERV